MLALKVMLIEGLLLFALATIIILSLIPLYLKTSSIEENLQKRVKTIAFHDNETIYLQYQASADNNSSTTGTIVNLDEVESHLNKALHLDDILKVESGQVQAGLSRRRRHLSEITKDQGLMTSILLRCRIKPEARCLSGSCPNAANKKVNRAIQRYPDLSNIPLQINNTQTGPVQYQYSAKFVDLATEVPLIFAGESKTLSFVAVQSGSFNQPSTWADNIVPYGVCHVMIPSGIIVTLSRSALELNVRQFNINGTLVLGSSKHATFTFHYPTNLIVHSGGILHDKTIEHKIYVAQRTQWTIHSGALMIGSNTYLHSYSSLPAASNVIHQKHIGNLISGPHTCAVLPDGNIQTFSRITFIAVESNDFLQTQAWLTETIPSEQYQQSIGDLGLYVAPKCTLSTSSLNGVLNIQFSLITIAQDATFELGNSQQTNFIFNFPTNIIVQNGGILRDLTLKQEIYYSVGSILTIHQGGTFAGRNTMIYSYTALPAVANTKSNFSIGSQRTGPFTCGFLSQGTIQTFDQVTFIAVQSGEFTQKTTWLADFIPTSEIINVAGSVGLYVAPQCHLSTASLNGVMNFKFDLITVAEQAIFELGSTTTNKFTFNYATNIIIQQNAIVQDLTIEHKVYFTTNSLITIHQGGSFVGSNTIIYSYNQVSTSMNVVGNYSFTSKVEGPFTCGIMPSGEVKTFNRITVLAVQSGDFHQSTVWLGDLVPTIQTVDLFIATGCQLSTHSLNGRMEIRFERITVNTGAILRLGGSTTKTFTLVHSTSLIVLEGGIVEDITIDHQVVFNVNSVVMVHNGATFKGSNTVISTSISTSTFKIETSINGPFTCGVQTSGVIETFNKVTYMVVQSGEFSQTDIWLAHLMPTVDVSSTITDIGLYIAPQCHLSTTSLNGVMTIKFDVITVAEQAVFELGSTTSNSFTFNYATNIVVRQNAVVRDLTIEHKIYHIVNSVIIIHQGGSFVGLNTIIYSYTGVSTSMNVVANYSFTSKVEGPFTCGIMPSGQIETFKQVTYIAVQSGEFNQAATWLGNVVPYTNIAISNVGFGLYVESGCQLRLSNVKTTQLSLFKSITVANNAVLILTSSQTMSFTFEQGVNIIVMSGGTIRDETIDHKIYIATNSAITIYEGGTFFGSNTVFYSYSALTEVKTVTSNITIINEQNGPFTCAIYPQGTIETFNQITFVAVQTGDFYQSTTWLAAFVPTVEITNTINHVGIHVAQGCHLTTTSLNGVFDTRFEVIRIDTGAIFELTSTSTTTSFTFNYATNIIVEQGGIFRDQTTSHHISFASNTLLIVYEGGIFEALNTMISNYSITSNVQGPFTCAVFSTGVIQTFNEVTFIAVQSGEFTQKTTWLANFMPTVEIINVAGSVGLYIAPQCHLSTASLNGVMNIKFDLITVAEQAIFELGSTTIKTFTFNYATNIIIQQNAIVQDLTIEHKVYFTSNSLITIHQGGSFVGSNTIIYSYSQVSTSMNVVANYSFTSKVEGPFTCGIMPSGEIKTFNQITYIAVQSGEFNRSETWVAGAIPAMNVAVVTEGVHIYVNEGCHLSTASISGVFNFQVNSITVAARAVLRLGSTTDANFRFTYSTSIIVLSSGLIVDETREHQIYLIENSMFMIYERGSFVGNQTTIHTWTHSIEKQRNLTFTMGSQISGPFTCGVMLNGVIETFTKITFIVAGVGDFQQSPTWLGNFVPTVEIGVIIGGIDVYVPTGCQLTTSGLQGVLNIQINSITIAPEGILVLGNNETEEFSFKYSINLIILPRATCLEHTINRRIQFASNTVINVHAGGSFAAAGTTIFSYTSSEFQLTTSITGPWTCGILSDGVIKTFDKITFITYQSGSFLQSTTWLGGIAPTSESAQISNGIDIYVAPGCNLSTDDLNGSLDIQINDVTVSETSVFQLGGTSVNTFTFYFPVNIVVLRGGIIQDQTISNQIYLGFDSMLTVQQGGSFIGTNTILHRYVALPPESNVAANFTVIENSTNAFSFTESTTEMSTFMTQRQFVIVASGSFNSTSTWLNGLIPTGEQAELVGGLDVLIATNCTLTIDSPDDLSNILIRTITVSTGGHLVLGLEHFVVFSFNNAINIIVYTGGTIEVRTMIKELYLPIESQIVLYPGGKFIGFNTTVLRMDDSSMNEEHTSHILIENEYVGPMTLIVFTVGEIQVIPFITYFTVQSGDFFSSKTWLGGFVPNVDLSLLAGGINLYISKGHILSLTGVYGYLKHQINYIEIAEGARCLLGTPLVQRDFVFRFPIGFIIRGELVDFTHESKGLYLPPGSSFYIHSSGSFLSKGPTFLYSYFYSPRIVLAAAILGTAERPLIEGRQEITISDSAIYSS